MGKHDDYDIDDEGVWILTPQKPHKETALITLSIDIWAFNKNLVRINILAIVICNLISYNKNSGLLNYRL